MLTMGQAAKEAGISKATLSRAIKNGRVSASRNEKGGFDIDPAELFRVYARNAAKVARNGSMKRDATGSVTVDETPVLRAEIDGLRTQLALVKDQLDDVKGQRDGWQRQAELSQRLLADARPRRGLFSWLSASGK